MAINKKLIHFKNKTKFDEELAKHNINDTSICFIQDTQQIWTHGQLYNCNITQNDIPNSYTKTESDQKYQTRLTIDTELNPDSNNPIANSVVANAIKGGVHFRGIYPNLPTEVDIIYNENGECIGMKASWYDEPDEIIENFYFGDIVIVATETEGGLEFTNNVNQEYILAKSFDENGDVVNWVELGDVTPAQSMIDNALKDYYKKSEVYNKSESDGKYQLKGDYATQAQVSTALATKANVSDVYTKEQTDETINLKLSALDTDHLIRITYSDLVNLRNSKSLIPGRMYRITDYRTTTSQWKTASAEHQFDIVVTALSENTLSEEALALRHEGDEYFSTSNLAAWKIWYSLDNDLTRFAWAFPKVIKVSCEEDAENFLYVRYPKCDANNQYAWAYINGSEGKDVYENFDWTIVDSDLIYTTTEAVTLGMTVVMGDVDVTVVDISEGGKGVIYRMIDEYNNDLPYDFKNILFGEIHQEYTPNDFGSSIDLNNPVYIAYTLLVDVDEEYNGKNDVIVELSTCGHPDTGEETWALYKTEEGYNEVDYRDMFVFVDKYDYDGQTWDRWRKAEDDGESYKWVSHKNSGMYILTEELLEVSGQNTTYRYTFNAEEYLEDLDYADASMHSSSTPLMECKNNTMKPCTDVVSNIHAQYCLPFNVFKMYDESCHVNNNAFGSFCYNNTFLESCINNIFNGGFTDNICTSVAENSFGVSCGNNAFNSLSYSFFGPEIYYNIITGGLIFAKGDVYNCKIEGWDIRLDGYMYDLHLSGDDVNVKSIKNSSTLIEVPAHEMTLTVAQNSRGEIKIYNEADLIA